MDQGTPAGCPLGSFHLSNSTVVTLRQVSLIYLLIVKKKKIHMSFEDQMLSVSFQNEWQPEPLPGGMIGLYNHRLAGDL